MRKIHVRSHSGEDRVSGGEKGYNGNGREAKERGANECVEAIDCFSVHGRHRFDNPSGESGLFSPLHIAAALKLQYNHMACMVLGTSQRKQT